MKARHWKRPDWRITLATLLFCALTIAAARWQAGRAEYKEGQQALFEERHSAPAAVLGAAQIEPADYDQRPVVAQGVYEPKYGILVDNKVHEGRAGYQVYTPLKIENSDMYVLVNRGWVPQGRTRADLPRIATPAGPQRIAGVGTIPPRFMELKAEAAQGVLWQNLALESYGAWSGLKLQPIVVQQTDEIDDGLVREYVRPDFGIEKHRIYSLQWYSFCLLAAFLYVFFHFKRVPRAD